MHMVLAGLLMLGSALSPAYAETPEVRVGVYQNSPKIFVDDSGKASGILIDLLRRIAEREGWSLSFVPCKWAECLDELGKGKIDLLPDVAYSEGRDRRFDFHRIPALYSWSQIYRRRNVAITSPFDLDHKRIALLAGGIQAEGFKTMAHGFGLTVQTIPAASLAEAFRLVQQGKADAAVSNHYFGEFHARDYRLVETPVVFQPSRLFYATAHGHNASLLAGIDRNLAAWQQDPGSPYYVIIKRWGGEVQSSFIPPHIWNTLMVVSVLALALLFGTLFLRRQVRQRTRQLAAKSEHLQTTMDAIPDLMCELDLDGRIHDYHAPRSSILDIPAAKLIGKTLAEVMPPEATSVGMQALHEANENGWSGGRQYELQLPQGRYWFELSVARKPSDSGQGGRFIVLAHDITPVKAAEAKVQRLAQLYAALSYCNKAIVHCNNEAELFPQICHDAVEYGGMKMAWIGMLDETEGLVRPVTAFGSGQDYLKGLEISVDADQPSGRGPSGTAIRENRPVWCQDFASDPLTAPWRERAAQFGWAASAALPLRRKGAVVGVLTLYAGEVNAFDDAQQKLLVEMSMDISFALDRFYDEAHRLQLEDSVRKLSLAAEQSPSSILITDLDANIIYANATFLKQSGYAQLEVIGQSTRILQSGKTPRQAYDDLWAHLRRGDMWRGELINRRKDGSEYIASAMISPVRDADGNVTSYLSVQDDVTEKKRTEERIQHLAHFDQLTGLPNRMLLQDRFKYALSLAQRAGEHLAVMFLDLDNFKSINDTLGHTVGDRLLMDTAVRLKAAIREEDSISRLGGDEFIFILPGTDANGAARVAEKLRHAISEPYLIEQYELTITPSIGIAIYPEDGGDIETLSKNADTAMYRAKQAGRNDYCFFTREMQANSARNLELNNALRYALARNQLQLHYQPQISLQDGRHVTGAEALLRWEHPELGAISPAEFIPLAEASGQILQIGEWVLRTAAAQMKAWMDSGLAPKVIAVNLSAVQFRHANLTEMVSTILVETGLPPSCLELELTEAAAMDDPLAAIAVMDRLHERGIRMAIDDFGTGYSSLSYLKRFKIYKLKIDQSFVRDITSDPEDKAIVTAIINMANSLGMSTIAEGVETEGQLSFLQQQGCGEVQGYYFAKPLPADEFERYLRGKK